MVKGAKLTIYSRFRILGGEDSVARVKAEVKGK